MGGLRWLVVVAMMVQAVPAGAGSAGGAAAGPVAVVTLTADRVDGPVDGRLLLLVSDRPGAEPRFQVDDRPDSQLVFGVDVEGLAPGASAAIGPGAVGYPLARLGDLPAGDYRVQALLHRYETFHRSDGHVVRLPMDRGEGQQWNRAPGNLYSEPRQVHLDPGSGTPIELELAQVIPPIEPPADTAWVKHVRIRSALLSEFWGREMELGAHVLLPAGFDEHPDAHYPMAILHGHFPHDFDGFRTVPPDDGLAEPDWGWIAEHCPNGHHPECDAHGYERVRQQAAYDLYRWWLGPDAPRVLVVTLQHPTPYYDDSYAVNSANMGPYGDAITHELLPAVEERFRGLGPWARALYGGSTGGWESLAAQVFYPEEYNGAWASCPDPVDFRAYTVVDLTADDNAYFLEGRWLRVPRPGWRNARGEVLATLQMLNRYEAALGSRGRSGQQWDAWQAVFSPVASDGYPMPIWDKETGEIDREVAASWVSGYDLRAVMERGWPELGPKLEGKIHVYVGDMDNFYLDGAVRLLERFLDRADPPAEAEIAYGDGQEHCWSGQPDALNAVSRLTYHQRFLPLMVEHWLRTAPPGADTTSWRY